MSKKELNQNIRIIHSHLPLLSNTYGVRKIGIFGSVARGDQTHKSDLDILVDFKKPIGFLKFIELEDLLSRALKRKVDLTSVKALKPLIKKDILKETFYVQTR